MKTKVFVAILGCLFFSITQSTALPTGKGENIFTTRCIACHRIDKDFAGPALAKVDKRHTMNWIINFVHSSQTVIKSGDTSAIALFTKFNGTVMPDHPDLTNDDIASVVEYIKEESTKVVAVADVPFEKPYQEQPNYSPIGSDNFGFILSYIVVVITLILVLLFAVHVKQLERKMHG